MTAKFKHYVTPTPPNRMVVSLSMCYYCTDVWSGFDPTDGHGNFSVARANKWGYARLAATEQRLTVEFVTNEDGAIWDTSTLVPWQKFGG